MRVNAESAPIQDQKSQQDKDLERQGIPLQMPPAPVYAKNIEWSTSFVLFPADMNHNDTGFGGKLLAEMDRTAGMTMRRFLYDSVVHKAVTIGITDVEFEKFCVVGDMLVVTGRVVKVGKSTATIKVTIEREGVAGIREVITHGLFTFCSWDGVSKSLPHGLTLPVPEPKPKE